MCVFCSWEMSNRMWCLCGALVVPRCQCVCCVGLCGGVLVVVCVLI